MPSGIQGPFKGMVSFGQLVGQLTFGFLGDGMYDAAVVKKEKGCSPYFLISLWKKIHLWSRALIDHHCHHQLCYIRFRRGRCWCSWLSWLLAFHLGCWHWRYGYSTIALIDGMLTMCLVINVGDYPMSSTVASYVNNGSKEEKYMFNT